MESDLWEETREDHETLGLAVGGKPAGHDVGAALLAWRRVEGALHPGARHVAWAGASAVAVVEAGASGALSLVILELGLPGPLDVDGSALRHASLTATHPLALPAAAAHGVVSLTALPGPAGGCVAQMGDGSLALIYAVNEKGWTCDVLPSSVAFPQNTCCPVVAASPWADTAALSRLSEDDGSSAAAWDATAAWAGGAVASKASLLPPRAPLLGLTSTGSLLWGPALLASGVRSFAIRAWGPGGAYLVCVMAVGDAMRVVRLEDVAVRVARGEEGLPPAQAAAPGAAPAPAPEGDRAASDAGKTRVFARAGDADRARWGGRARNGGGLGVGIRRVEEGAEVVAAPPGTETVVLQVRVAHAVRRHAVRTPHDIKCRPSHPPHLPAVSGRCLGVTWKAFTHAP